MPRSISLQISDETRRAIEESAHLAGRDFSSLANEMLHEAVKSRRVPGIIFADGPSGRRARVAGSGVDVWEVARDYAALGQSWERLAEHYHWLSEPQLRAALAYAEAFPREVAERLNQEDSLDAEATWREYPFLRPMSAS